MLVIKQKVGEQTAIELADGRICFVTLTEVCDPGNVRIGFTFPRELPIYRDEVWRGAIADLDQRYAVLADRPIGKPESPEKPRYRMGESIDYRFANDDRWHIGTFDGYRSGGNIGVRVNENTRYVCAAGNVRRREAESLATTEERS